MPVARCAQNKRLNPSKTPILNLSWTTVLPYPMITLVIHGGLTAPPLSRILRLAWFFSLAAVIIGSLLPAQSAAMRLIDRAGVNDTVEHFAAYAVLAALPSLGLFRPRRLQAIVVFLFLLGTLLELAQIFSPGRTCDWHDLLANSGGIVAGAALASITRRAFRLPFPSPVDSSPPSSRSSQHPRN